MTYDRAMWLLLGAGLAWREADEIARAAVQDEQIAAEAAE